MGQTAIKTASKLLQRISHNDNTEETMVLVGIIAKKEADNDVDFFLSQLDNVISICNTLKGAIIKESKQ